MADLLTHGPLALFHEIENDRVLFDGVLGVFEIEFEAKLNPDIIYVLGLDFFRSTDGG